MRQLKLRLEELQVESFATGAENALKGTVHAHQEEGDSPTYPPYHTCDSCPPAFTCDTTCPPMHTCETCPPKYTCDWPCSPATANQTCGPTEWGCC